MNRRAEQDDPRLWRPLCDALQPVAELHRNPWFAVFDRGGRITVEYHRRQVTVLPVVAGDGVVMVRSKRPVLADCPLEFPAGAIEEGESPPAAAARELREEAGIGPVAPHRLEPLPPIAAAPNREPVLHHVYRIDLTRREFEDRQAFDHEITEVVLLDAAEARRLVASGGIYATLPLALLLHFFLGLPPDGP